MGHRVEFIVSSDVPRVLLGRKRAATSAVVKLPLFSSVAPDLKFRFSPRLSVSAVKLVLDFLRTTIRQILLVLRRFSLLFLRVLGVSFVFLCG